MRDRRGHQRAGWSFEPRNARRFKGQNTVQTQSGPPPDVLANYNQVYSQAQNVAAQPFTPYSGSTVAGFTPMQQAGFNDINTAANAAQPFQNAAAGYVTNAATSIDPSNFGGTVSQYQSPYTQQVVDATQKQFNNNNAIQQNQLSGNAASAGAFGGDRQAVAQAVLAGQQDAQQAPVIAGLYNTGFQNAASAAESNAYLNSSAGAEMGALGQTAQGEGLNAANAELSGGAQQQALAQQELNVPYQAYLAALGYPYQTTGWLEGMATGTGSASGTAGSTSSPGPSTLSQVAGAGLTGVAGYNLANQAGLFNSGAAGGAGNLATTSGAVSSLANDVWVARGGRIPGFAPGGEIPGTSTIEGPTVLNVDAGASPPSVSGNGMLGGSSNLLGGGGNMLGPTGNMLGPTGNLVGGGGNLLTTPTGTTSTTTGGPSEIVQILGDAGQIAAGIYGGPVAGLAAGAFNQAVGIKDGGRVSGFAPGGHVAPDIEDFAHHAKIAGLSPVPVRPRGFDTGGNVTPGLTASVGGNPMLVQAAQTYNGLPTDQLRQMAARYSPSTPQGQLVQRALQMRQLYPQSNPGQPTVPQPGAGSSSGPPPSMYARGGDTEDDNTIPDLPMAQPGPSVPGGLSAGLTAMQPSPQAMLATHAMAMNATGSYVPPPPDLAPVVLAAANKYSVDPKALAWMLSQESHWNPNAYNPESGTAGLGQFKPGTAKEMAINPLVPGQAIDGAAHYLSQKLAQTGGDYEAAIGRYGTFSTGHGQAADNAVRQQYRAFMHGDSRGGAVGGFSFGGAALRADAGGVDVGDDGGDLYTYADTAETVPQAGLASTPGANGAGLAPAGVTDGSGASIPLPPTPPPQAGPDPLPGDKEEARSTLKADPWQSVLTAGLSMMAGTSPHAMTNIGAGGVAGVRDYEQQRQLAIQDQQRADLAKTNQAWRQAQGILAGARANAIPAQTSINQQNADARTAAAAAAGKRADASGLVGEARAKYIQEQTALAPQVADARTATAGAATTRAGAASDVANATVPLRQAQTAAIPAKTSIDQQNADARTTAANAAAQRADAAGLVGQARADYINQQTQLAPTIAVARTTTANAAAQRAVTNAETAPVIAGARVTTAQTGQQSLALRQQALRATLAQRGETNLRNATLDEQRRVNTATDQQLRAMVANKDVLTPANNLTPQQAGTMVTRLRQQSQGLVGVPTVTPAPSPPAAPKVTAPVAVTPPTQTAPSGLPTGAKLAPDGNYYVPNPSGGWLKAVPAGG